MSRSISPGDVVRGAAAGLIGGAVASWVMTQYQAATQKPSPGRGGHREAASQAAAGRPERLQQEGGDDATVKTAQAISRGLFDRDLTPAEKQVAGQAVHYGYGSVVGGLYGAVAEAWPTIGAGFGMAYGVALWAFGDEVAVPAFRLGPPPTQIPGEKHADFLAGHIVFGITLDVVRRVARLLM